MTTTTTNKQYFNDAQQYLISMNPRFLIAVCGRGFGKGAVQAARLLSNVQGMPRSCGGFVGPNARRVLTNILPSMLIHLERWGYRRDEFFMVGKKPPKSLGWDSPLFTPDDWGNTISFWNGSIVNIISQDRSGTSNSMSLDYLIIDEAKFIDADKLRNETFQANRGNNQYFGHFYGHHGMTITSDMPTTKKESWFLSYVDKMNDEIVQTLWVVCLKIRKIKLMLKEQPRRRNEILPILEKWRKVRNNLRRECLLYAEFTSLENIDLLGEDFVRNMKRDLPKQIFLSSVMSLRQRVSRDGFYGAMDEYVNIYTAPLPETLKLENISRESIGKSYSLDTDVNPRKPLLIGCDANSLFNAIVVGQTENDKLKVVNSFFTKNERKMTDAVDDMCKYYKDHPRHQVVFYYDTTFKGATTGKTRDNLYKIIQNQFLLNGWRVRLKYIGQPMGHVDKNLFITEMLTGNDNKKFQVVINGENNKDLVIALEEAKVKNGHKDKSAEKNIVETEETLREHRTDFTDAFDTLCIGTERFSPGLFSSAKMNDYPR